MADRLGSILWQLPPSRAFDADDLAAMLDLLPRALNGRPLHHALEVRHRSFLCEADVELARVHGVPTVFADSPDYPSLADLTSDFIYARLMRSANDHPAGYAPKALDAWATRARQWAHGDDPAELPHVMPPRGTQHPRNVLIFFIGSAKQRNPAAAMALQARLDGLR